MAGEGKGYGAYRTGLTEAKDYVGSKAAMMGVERGTGRVGTQYTDPFDIEARSREIGGDVRAGQMDLVNMMMNRARGIGTSPAEMQLRRGMERRQAGAHSMAAGASPMNRALASRMGVQAAGQAGAQFNLDAAQLRAQEQIAAMQGAAGVFGGMRGADIQAQAVNDALMQQGFARDVATQQARMGEEQLRAQNFATMMQPGLTGGKPPSDWEKFWETAGPIMLGGLFTLGGGALAGAMPALMGVEGAVSAGVGAAGGAATGAAGSLAANIPQMVGGKPTPPRVGSPIPRAPQATPQAPQMPAPQLAQPQVAPMGAPLPGTAGPIGETAMPIVNWQQLPAMAGVYG